MYKEENVTKEALVRMTASHSNSPLSATCNCGGPIITDASGRTRRIHSVNCPSYTPPR